MKVKVDLEDILEMVYWARRYCDGRSTYAPSSFNKRYQNLNYETMGQLQIQDKHDDTLTNEGEYWPFAQDGMFNPETFAFDARPQPWKSTVQSAQED